MFAELVGLPHSDPLCHETVHTEMTQTLQGQLKDLPGIQLTAITVEETSRGGDSASYSVELRLTTNADLNEILQKMQS